MDHGLLGVSKNVPEYSGLFDYLYNYWDLGIIVNHPLKNCQDDIL